jgi:hypothetical protein
VAIVTKKDVAEIKEHFDQRTAEVASSGWSRSLSPESVRSPGRVIVSGPDIDSALCVAVTAFLALIIRPNRVKAISLLTAVPPARRLHSLSRPRN